MPRFDDVRRVSLADALSPLPGARGERFREVFRHGSLHVEVYAPRDVDAQTPHTRDEVYVVAAGRGSFVTDEGALAFAVGDFLFAPAGMRHHFADFSHDLALWVFFYGPEGGERSSF